MIFTELRFAGFFVVVFCCYWALRRNDFRKALLVIASYVFYAAWDWRFLGLLLLSTFVDFYAARLIESRAERRRLWLALALTCNFVVLGFFKYYNFFADSFSELMRGLGVQVSPLTLNVILPAGISFYTFHTVSYTVDVFRKNYKAESSPLDYALFVSFFPLLVAGPIIRAAQFLPQLKAERRFAQVNVKPLLMLFAIGYLKKIAGDVPAPFVDAAFADPQLYSGSALLAANILFGAQLYCDFSGYSDMAIATAGLLGYQLPKNFSAPYLATTLPDLWRRWHISLTTWMRDYVYFSLGGNRGGEWRVARNTIITFLLVGLWHGAGWNFVVWGAIHGVILSAFRQYRRCMDHYCGGFELPDAVGTLLSTGIAILLMVLFRAPDLQSGLRFWEGFFRSEGLAAPDYAYPLFLALAGIHIVNTRWQVDSKAAALPLPWFGAAVGLMFVIALGLVQPEVRPFIYFQF